MTDSASSIRESLPASSVYSDSFEVAESEKADEESGKADPQDSEKVEEAQPDYDYGDDFEDVYSREGTPRSAEPPRSAEVEQPVWTTDKSRAYQIFPGARRVGSEENFGSSSGSSSSASARGANVSSANASGRQSNKNTRSSGSSSASASGRHGSSGIFGTKPGSSSSSSSASGDHVNNDGQNLDGKTEEDPAIAARRAWTQKLDAQLDALYKDSESASETFGTQNERSEKEDSSSQPGRPSPGPCLPSSWLSKLDSLKKTKEEMLREEYEKHRKEKSSAKPCLSGHWVAKLEADMKLRGPDVRGRPDLMERHRNDSGGYDPCYVPEFHGGSCVAAREISNVEKERGQQQLHLEDTATTRQNIYDKGKEKASTAEFTSFLENIRDPLIGEMTEFLRELSDTSRELKQDLARYTGSAAAGGADGGDADESREAGAGTLHSPERNRNEMNSPGKENRNENRNLTSEARLENIFQRRGKQKSKNQNSPSNLDPRSRLHNSRIAGSGSPRRPYDAFLQKLHDQTTSAIQRKQYADSNDALTAAKIEDYYNSRGALLDAEKTRLDRFVFDDQMNDQIDAAEDPAEIRIGEDIYTSELRRQLAKDIAESNQIADAAIWRAENGETGEKDGIVHVPGRKIVHVAESSKGGVDSNETDQKNGKADHRKELPLHPATVRTEAQYQSDVAELLIRRNQTQKFGF